MARRVRPDQRRVAGVRGGGGQPESSLATDHRLERVETLRGVRHDMAQAGGRWHAEERLCEAVAILRISRRRKAMYAWHFRKLN
jgi:hypothetical protein